MFRLAILRQGVGWGRGLSGNGQLCVSLHVLGGGCQRADIGHHF